MEKSTIIKLRQAEANEVDINGSYKVSLAQGINLEDGDMVKVHSVILDTATESVIVLPDDVTVKMGVAKYNRNFILNDIAYTPSPTGPTMPDLKNQIVCVKSTTPGTGVYRVGWIVISPTKTREIPVFTSSWSYIQPVTGAKLTHPITFGPFKAREHLSKNIIVPVDFIVNTKSFVNVDSQKTLRQHGMNPFTFVQQVTAEKDIDVFGDGGMVWANDGGTEPAAAKLITIHEEVCEFILPAATYEPAEIAQIVNDNMTKIDSLGPIGNRYTDPDDSLAFPFNNPFLSSVAQQIFKIGLLGTVANPAELIFNPEATDAQPAPPSLLLPPATPTVITEDRFLGGNQVSMNYDENLKKLNFDSLHMPVYVGPAGSDPTVPLVGTGVPGVAIPLTPLPPIPQVNAGGNFFTRLEPPEFWRTLGFDDIVVPTVYSTDTIQLTGGDTVLPLIFNLELGKNIIGALPTIDGVVAKSTDGLYLIPSILPTENSFTTPILASRRFNEVIIDEGYYLLEIGMKIPQEMIGGVLKDGARTGSNKVQSIITKYFTSGNFLQESGAGSVVYTHQGEPQMINDFDVRVVHPDFSAPSNDELGQRNSVFLEIIKAVKPQFPTAVSPK